MSTSFKPSDIRLSFPNSRLKNGEGEAMVCFIVAWLAANGDEWGKTMAWNEPLKPAIDPSKGDPAAMKAWEESLPPAYQRMHPINLAMLNGPMGKGVIQSIWRLVEEWKFLEWVAEKESYKVTQALIDFCADYAPQKV